MSGAMMTRKEWARPRDEEGGMSLRELWEGNGYDVARANPALFAKILDLVSSMASVCEYHVEYGEPILADLQRLARKTTSPVAAKLARKVTP